MIIYRVDDREFEDIEDVIDYCCDEDYYDDDDGFEEWVNNDYGSITIYGTTYYAYDILENADNGDLDSLRDDYKHDCNESDKDNARYELRNADVGDEIYCQGYTIYVCEENTGDTDGDDIDFEERIEMTRRFIDEQKLIAENKIAREKKDEEDLMSLFQVIGE